MQFPAFDVPEEMPEAPFNLFTEDVDMPLLEEDLVFPWLDALAADEGKVVRELNYIFCSDEHLRGINIEFLDHDYYTDIITFDNSSGNIVAGEMYISTERVADNAASLNIPFEQELRRVMAHGLLHLIGYGDKTPEEEVLMRTKEDHYLRKYGN